MAKRRNVLVGLGALAMGSGALITQASFENHVDLGEADFQVIAAADLVVRRGDDGWDNSSISFEDIDPQDVPTAAVDSGFNDELNVQVARRNNAAEQAFSHLLEVENQDATAHDIAITFEDFGEDVDTTGGGSYDWSTSADSDNIHAGDVAEMFRFEAVSSGGSHIAWISPDPGDSEPEEEVNVGSGDTVNINLVTDQGSTQVRAVNKKAGGDGDDDPFSGPADADAVDLLDNIRVGVDYNFEE